jgi:hypothetical protein
MDWGYSIPHMITGMLNMHPQDAIQLTKDINKENGDGTNFVKFYESLLADENA